MSLAAGAVVAVLSFSLSMAFRRRFRGDGIAFYVIMLALMTPGFLLGLGTQLLWKAMGIETALWWSALGANSVWGIPFGFLVMLAVWNRYDEHIEEAAHDLGANVATTFREVTLPLVWTGIFGAALFGFTLTWNDFDRTVLLVRDNTLPLQIVGPDPGVGDPPGSVRARHRDHAGHARAHLRSPDRRLRAPASARPPRRAGQDELGLEGAIDAEAAAQAGLTS